MSKSVWRGIAIFLLLIIIGSAIVGYIFYKRGNIKFLSDEDLEIYNDAEELYTEYAQYINNGSVLTVEQETEQDLSVSVMALSSAEFASYGVNTLAESAYVLTATLYPSDATNKNVEWNISFADPDSEWASGKNISDYVTFSSYELSATVSCLQAFGEQIVITVTSESNSAATANCTVDYVQRINSVSLASTTLAFGSAYNGSSYNLADRIVTIDFEFDLTDGTIAPEISYSATMTLADLPEAYQYAFFFGSDDVYYFYGQYFYANTSDVWSYYGVNNDISIDSTGIEIRLGDLQITNNSGLLIPVETWSSLDTTEINEIIQSIYLSYETDAYETGENFIYGTSTIYEVLLYAIIGYDSKEDFDELFEENYANWLVQQISTLSGTLNVSLTSSYGDETFATFNESFSLTFDFTDLIGVASLSLSDTGIYF